MSVRTARRAGARPTSSGSSDHGRDSIYPSGAPALGVGRGGRGAEVNRSARSTQDELEYSRGFRATAKRFRSTAGWRRTRSTRRGSRHSRRRSRRS